MASFWLGVVPGWFELIFSPVPHGTRPPFGEEGVVAVVGAGVVGEVAVVVCADVPDEPDETMTTVWHVAVPPGPVKVPVKTSSGTVMYGLDTMGLGGRMFIEPEGPTDPTPVMLPPVAFWLCHTSVTAPPVGMVTLSESIGAPV